MSVILRFINTAPDNPHRKSEVFGPYRAISIQPERIVCWGKEEHDPFEIAQRDSDLQWYCDADGDLYTDARIEMAVTK